MIGYYDDLHLKNIISRRFGHLFFLLFWPAYFIAFALCERYVTPIYNVYCPTDDLIPFCEFFIIPYFAWYILLMFVTVYTLLFDIAAFKKFYVFLILTSAISFSIYLIFPNMQNLRPNTFARDNFFTRIMAFVYKVDTNTNVCPSLHVVFSVGMTYALWDTKRFGTAPVRRVMIAISGIICMSTVFLKQHSIIDVGAGALLSAFVCVVFSWKNQNKNIF